MLSIIVSFSVFLLNEYAERILQTIPILRIERHLCKLLNHINIRRLTRMNNDYKNSVLWVCSGGGYGRR